jgi:asparagine synthase (glutamine-hydrolysing)
MCGIAGAFYFHHPSIDISRTAANAIEQLSKRGPDSNGYIFDFPALLIHTRLAIIDTTNAAAQPFTDTSGRYTIVFNGEIFNYRELKQDLIAKGFQFQSQSDTEVLLYLYIVYGIDCLRKLNGFFAFAIYDKQERSLFIARDRYGVKPLYYYKNEEAFYFSSELKALKQFDIKTEIDKLSLRTYFQINYIPPPFTIYDNVYKLEPGYCISINNSGFEKKQWYNIVPNKTERIEDSYSQAKDKIKELLDNAVQKRLISDVPLGCFLSGGIDSSIITALAAKHSPNINTFSIGYKDEKYFDETNYAQLVAKMHNTNHTVFSLSNDDLLGGLYDMLEYIDEPFADSSALSVYILCRETRKNVTVALSGDGADELFSGYNKHAAELKIRNAGILERIIAYGKPVWQLFPSSRNSFAGNKLRQLQKFSEGYFLSKEERYWRWAGFMNDEESMNFYNLNYFNANNESLFRRRRKPIYTQLLSQSDNFNNYLLTDQTMVLTGDMLTKVDLMSMANSLEVRTPFLDYRLVDYVNRLPSNYKIDKRIKKKILQDSFKELLPQELYNRPKKGFEVPLYNWFNKELKSKIENEWLNDKIIEEQGIFNPQKIRELKKKIFSKNPGDSAASIWALIVFQYWMKRNN